MAQKHFDLIVVGAGVVGTFHAYHALKKGLSVLLLEKDAGPQSATVRNFGQVVPSGMAGRWFDYGVRGLEIYQDIQQQFDISVRKNGSVYLASDPEEQQLLHESKQIFDTKGYVCELLTRQQCLQQWPSLNAAYVLEGLYFPQEISVEPELMIHRLIAFMQQRYTHFVYRNYSAATAIESTVHGVRVNTAQEENFTAEKSIICSGAEFRLLFPKLYNESGMMVSKLQMMRSFPLPDVSLSGNILTGLSIRRYESFTECPSYSTLKTPKHYEELKKWGVHILFKQTPDGSIVIGDSHEYAEAAQSEQLGFHINQDINDLILQEAQRIVTFDVRQIASSWAGYYSQHADEIFSHKFHEHVHIFTGIGGKGMTSSAGYTEENIASLF